ncbi:MAG: HAD hydrolase family protein [bacterium]|nr:HAD hydrolase family protein [bacterium]
MSEKITFPGEGRVADLAERARRVRLVVMDVDGVLTAGGMISDSGGVPVKIFNVKDGLGLYLLGRVGIKRAIVTGKSSRAVEKRAEELELEYCIQGALDKGPAVRELLRAADCAQDGLCYIGDDLNDLPGLVLAGLACCPADAAPDVRGLVHYVCAADGGRGAVREVCELILRARGEWDAVVERWMKGNFK